jgi:hypothetical protein
MILFSVGLPSGFTDFCDATVLHLARAALGDVQLASFNTLEELAEIVIRTGAAHLVGACRQPSIRLQMEIAQTGRPFVVALGDPRTALGDLAHHRGVELAEATRAIASSCAAMQSLAAAPGALVLSGADGRDPVALRAAIARHFEFNVGNDEVTRVVAVITECRLNPEYREAHQWWAQLEGREQAIVNGATQPYSSHFNDGADLEPLVWERELFYIYEDPPAASPVPATQPVDVTGRARVLIYGPGVNLPPGNWSAKVVLGFSAETAGMSFIVEVFAGKQLTCTRLQPLGAQVLEANLNFTIENTIEQRVEVRVLSERAAFDGRVALGYATLTRQAAVRPDAQEYLAEILRK